MDEELYLRGCRTLVASWEEYARGASDAAVHRLPGVAAAVFASGQEREVYNNALLDRGLTSGECVNALDAMEEAYAAAGITRFAAWIHEGDDATRAELERRGYRLDTTTRAMGMRLDHVLVPHPTAPVEASPWAEYLAADGLSADFLAAAGL